MVSVRFQGTPFNITVIQVNVLTTNVEEADVDWFYEDLQDLLELTPRKDVLFIIGDENAKVGTQEIPGVTDMFGLGVQNEAGQSLTDCCLEKKTDHSKHHLPTNKRQLCTWTSPDSQCRNQTDYIFAAKVGEALYSQQK